MVRFCIFLHIIPLPVVTVMGPGICDCMLNAIPSNSSPCLAVLMAPHAEHDVLVVLLLLLVALLAPLVLLVLTSVLLPLVVAWFPRIGALISKKFSKLWSKFRIISN